MDIAKAVAEKINERSSEEWLVVHYKDASALLSTVRDLVGPGVADRVHGLTWGRHHGTNAYAHVPNIVIVGQLSYGPHGYAAVAAAALGDGSAPVLTKDEQAAIEAGEVAHNLLQAVCRSQVRAGRNGIAGACHVYVCMQRQPGLDAIIDRCFPGHQRREWAPVNREELGGRNGQVVRYLATRFREGPYVTVTKQEVCQALGMKGAALSRCLKAEVVQEALWDWEIGVGWSCFRREEVRFDPVPGGGFTAKDS